MVPFKNLPAMPNLSTSPSIPAGPSPADYDLTALPADFPTRQVSAAGLEINVATLGEADRPPLLLLHGWPHTWFLWHRLMPALAHDYHVIAPDLRGIGGSGRPAAGYDLNTLADDAANLLDALGVREPLAAAVGIDLGAPVAWMLAMRHPGRVRRLVVMEALLGNLPGAESFLERGAPWWFGFHGVPDLAETVLVGHEAEYVDWFLTRSTHEARGVGRPARDAFVAAYTGREALRGGFAHYRAFGDNARQIQGVLDHGRVKLPTLAVGGGVVGEALFRQLVPVSDDLRGALVADCGHIIPLEQPRALLDLLRPFLGS